jgi:hypothetical protein
VVAVASFWPFFTGAPRPTSTDFTVHVAVLPPLALLELAEASTRCAGDPNASP